MRRTQELHRLFQVAVCSGIAQRGKRVLDGFEDLEEKDDDVLDGADLM